MNKDILFSLWYDSLEGTKSQGFAYKAWCAGWDAALAQPEQAHTDHPTRHWDRTCPACVAEQEPVEYDGPALYKAKSEREQAKKQEPVGQLCEEAFGRGQIMWFKDVPDNSLLYTAPPSKEWVSLTDEERNKLWKDVIGWGDPSHDEEDLMKAIEAALRSKNT